MNCMADAFDKTVLPLNSRQWELLRHAYGAAATTPGQLARLAAGDESALDELWSSLAHQYSIYTASIAAFPHLVQAARSSLTPDLRRQVLGLAGTICAWVSPETLAAVPDELLTGYRNAIPGALLMLQAVLDEPLDQEERVYLLQAAAALAGFAAGAGRVIDGFATKEFSCECPGCDRVLCIWPTEGGLATASEDPVVHKSTRFVPVQVDGPSAELRPMHAWLRREAERAGTIWLAPLMDSLFGTAESAGGS